MSTTPTHRRAIRMIATLIAALTIVGVAGAGFAQPASAATPAPAPTGPAYSTCPNSSCLLYADIITTGPTVVFSGQTRYFTVGSQWYLWVHRNGTLVGYYASDYLKTNKLVADLGALAPGGAYQLTVLVGTPNGEELMRKNFTTGPAVTATPTATNVSLGFTMPVGVSAKAAIRKQDGTLVATATSTGTGTTHLLKTAAVLNPTTTYRYQVDATDAQGRVYTRSGTFQTRSVRLEVKLTGLQITNDSDYFGAGELTAQMHLGSVKTWIWQTEKSVSTAGATPYFPLTTTAALPSAVRSVPIHVVVSDDDCEGIGTLCTGGTGNLAVGSGSTSEAQWATATFTANLPNTTATTPWTTFISGVNNPVGFIVTGSYRWVMV